MYKSFAEIYDELMDKSLYYKWLDFTDRFAPLGSKKVLDLACGTGDFSFMLLKDGYKVMGLDLSEEMLSIASSKLPDNARNIIFIKHDMRDLNGIGKFDIITCFADSLNYLYHFDEVEKVLINAYKCLNSNGILLFDVMSLYQADVIYRNYYYNYSDQKNSLLWNSYPGKLSHSVIHDLTIFKYDEQVKAYQRYVEQQSERAYEMSQYIQGLKRAGFKQIQTFANFGLKEIDPKTRRWFFVAQKS